MATEIRLDAGTVSAVRRTPQGGLRVDARLTRVGVLEYRNADGSTRRELRHPDEVFKADSLDTLRGAPVTDLHPSDMVRSDTFRELARGHVGDDVRSDGGRFVAATLYVQDAGLVDAVERGDRREISCGYTCSYDPTPGEWQGEKYDGRQVGITYNHAAIGPRDWGRAGSDVALRMDNATTGTSSVWVSACAEEGPPMPDEQRKDGEAPKPAEKKHDAGKCDSCGAPMGEDGKYAPPALDSADKVRADSLAGKNAAQEAEIEGLRKRLDEANDPKRLAALVGEVVAVRAVAERAGVERTDSLDVRALRVAVIEKVTGIRCDDKSADFIAGTYEAAVAMLDRSGPASVRAALDAPRTDGEPLGLIDSFRVSMEERARHSQKGDR